MPKSVAPGPVRAASGPRAAIGPRPPPQTPSPTTLRRSRTTGPPHRSPSPTAPRSTPSRVRRRGTGLFVHRSGRGAPFTITNQISPGSSLLPAFTVNTGATMALGDGAFAEIASLAGGGNVVVGPSDPSTTLIISGSNSTTFSGRLSGAGTLEIDGGAVLTLTGQGSTIGGVDLCNCDANGGLTINGGSLNVTRLPRPRHGGRRRNAFRHQWRDAADPQPGCRLLIRDGHRRGRIDRDRESQRIDGVCVYRRTSLGDDLQWRRAQYPGLVAIDAGDPVFTPTVTVTGSGSTWNVGSLAVGGGPAARSRDPEYSPFPMAASFMPRDPWASAIPTGTSMPTVTGAGSVLNALTSLVVGDTSCGCGLIGTLTVADGGVVNSPASPALPRAARSILEPAVSPAGSTRLPSTTKARSSRTSPIRSPSPPTFPVPAR